MTLFVEELEVWSGEVTEELEAWARWCALTVAELWDCPQEVRSYLELEDHGDADRLRRSAHASADRAASECSGGPPSRLAVSAARWASAREPASAALDAAIALCLSVGEGADADAVFAAAEQAQREHLRRLLLQRGLPRFLWSLIEVDEEVLCDELLGRHHGALRYRWGDGEPQENPVPPTDTRLTLLVGTREVWSGDVTEELRSWARWCALVVVQELECMDHRGVVRRYLETGDRALRGDAVTHTQNLYDYERGTNKDRLLHAASAATCACFAAVRDAQAAAKAAAAAAREATQAARVEVRGVQSARLRQPGAPTHPARAPVASDGQRGCAVRRAVGGGGGLNFATRGATKILTTSPHPRSG